MGFFFFFSMDFVFLLIFLVVPSVLGFNYSTAFPCPQNFKCQNGFYYDPLSSNTNNSLQSDSCGLCLTICNKSSHPKIFLSDQWFDVVEEFKNNVIKLHDPELQSLLDHLDCNSFNYKMNISKGFDSISYTIVRNRTLLICRKPYTPIKEMVDGFHGYRKYNLCANFDVYYLSLQSGGALFRTESLFPPGCSTIQLPVRPSKEVSNPSNLFDWLTADFELEWHTRDSCTGLCHREGIEENSCPRDAEDMSPKNSGQGWYLSSYFSSSIPSTV